MKWLSNSIIFLLCVFLCISTVYSARVKDIATILGVRDNQLVGYGLVVGLEGTGDKTNQAPFTSQSFQNMLLAFGLRMPDLRAMQLKNVAAVAISATLSPFAMVGQKMDVTISSLGNATSLRGGTLLMSPLKGADGKVYAVAQGSVVVSGFGTQGSDGSKVTVNVTCSGTVPNGGLVERTVDMPFVRDGAITLVLIQPDFTTALRVERAINQTFHARISRALDAGLIIVKINDLPGFRCDPCAAEDYCMARQRYVPVISRIENIMLNPAEGRAKVIVNSRSGTIVIGRNVTIAPVAVTHGNLSVIVTEKPYVSQPQAFSNGRTVTGKASTINVNQQNNRTFLFNPGPSLNDLVEAINRVGAAPGDLISILEAIKAAGALNGDLEVI